MTIFADQTEGGGDQKRVEIGSDVILNHSFILRNIKSIFEISVMNTSYH